MIVVIISGGSGSRLWPVSRQSDPKPFLKLSDGKSLLQNTFIRAKNLPNVKAIVTVTNEKLHFRMQDEYQDFNDDKIPCDFILEPFGRNTAAAIAAATVFIDKNYGNEPILVLPADHLITNEAAFKTAVDNAVAIANDDYIVTFGITPEYPETGYGYIEANQNEPIHNGFIIKRFVEKPDQRRAESYLNSGNYLWNSGMFLGNTATFINEFEQNASLILKTTGICLKGSHADNLGNSKIVHLDSKLFLHVENISVDYALFERSQKTTVVPCQIGWSDIGSWLSIAQTLPKDKDNNAIIGESVLHNTKNCLIYSTSRIIAGADIDNLVIVDTPDAVLIADKNNAQNVKVIFERLQKMKHVTSELHQTVHRPWGTYTVLEEGPLYKIKRIEVKPGASLSLQMHHHRSEHWIVVDGIASVTNGEKEFNLKSNESTYIPKEFKHRLENKTEDNLVLIEVQCGDYLGEDDIVRFDDIYGRVK